MVKKRSPTEVIEQSLGMREVEGAFVKFPGKETLYVPLEQGVQSVSFDYDTIRELWKKYGKPKYGEIHQHPDLAPVRFKLGGGTKPPQNLDNTPLPSGPDIYSFLRNDNAKTFFIAQQDASGKIRGYFVLRKTKRTNPFGPHKWSPMVHDKNFFQRYFSRGLVKGVRTLFITYRNLLELKKTIPEVYDRGVQRTLLTNNPKYIHEALKKIADKYGLRYRFIARKGYVLNEANTRFEHKRETSPDSDLEGKVSGTTAIIGLLGSILFLSSNLTGNVIGNLTNLTSNIIGVVFLLAGLVGGFFWIRNRKKK